MEIAVWVRAAASRCVERAGMESKCLWTALARPSLPHGRVRIRTSDPARAMGGVRSAAGGEISSNVAPSPGFVRARKVIRMSGEGVWTTPASTGAQAPPLVRARASDDDPRLRYRPDILRSSLGEIAREAVSDGTRRTTQE